MGVYLYSLVLTTVTTHKVGGLHNTNLYTDLAMLFDIGLHSDTAAHMPHIYQAYDKWHVNKIINTH